MQRASMDPMVKVFARHGRRDAAAGFREREAEARYDEIDAHLIAEARTLHAAYLEAVQAIDEQILEIEAALSVPPPPNVGTANAREQTDRHRREKKREALVARRAGSHLGLLDEVHQAQLRAQTRATAYWTAHREHRRDGEPVLTDPRRFEVDEAHLAPAPSS